MLFTYKYIIQIQLIHTIPDVSGLIRNNLQTSGAIAPIELALDRGKANLDFGILRLYFTKIGGDINFQNRPYIFEYV